VETFSEFSPLLSQHYRTYSPERRGHGRMPDPGGPIMYEIMATTRSHSSTQSALAPFTSLVGATAPTLP
jgi:hypothetical protein